MKMLTATEVSRNFASVLDRVEHGETLVITRGGHRLATIAPASKGNAAALLEYFSRRRVDDGFGDDVAAARAMLTDELSGTWPED